MFLWIQFNEFCLENMNISRFSTRLSWKWINFGLEIIHYFYFFFPKIKTKKTISLMFNEIAYIFSVNVSYRRTTTNAMWNGSYNQS